MEKLFTQEQLRSFAEPWMPSMRPNHRFRVYTDTSDFFRIDYGDILVLDGTPYLIRHNAKEGRFGLDDEVKFWVKRAIRLPDGGVRIIKLVFHEKFIARIGDIEFECFRSPRKEQRILDMVRDHPNFMHGFSVPDDHGNIVRILEMIQGPALSTYIRDLEGEHEAYFQELFPDILNNYIHCVRAIQFLHQQGEKHGDIRRDHILIDRETADYRWIDFDYNFRHRENMFGYDLFGLGNVLIYLTGKGDVLVQDLNARNHPALADLAEGDVNIVFNNRVANLQKVFPYIPKRLNRILLCFSRGSQFFYDNTSQFLEDLEEAAVQL